MILMTSRTPLLLALLLVCGAAVAQSGEAPPKVTRPVMVDRVLAVVNREVITQVELDERVQRAQRELSARRTPLPSREEIVRQMLERMIVDKVQLQYAKETGLQIDDLQLDAAINRLAEGNRLSLAEFRRALERDGIPFDKFREEVRNEIIIARLREREVDNKISVAENEISNLIEEQQGIGGALAEYNIGHILVQVPEQARPEQLERLRARAEEALKRLKSGGDFGQIAATYSNASDALQGGGMGWRGHDRLPELFAEELAKMRPGDLSGILRSPAGFHILKLIEKRGAGAPFMVEQTRLRHILVRVSEVVSEEDAKRKLSQLRERIVNGADFGELARQHSDDGSAARGGELGWIYPGDTVPEFERAFTGLPLKQVSEPVRTSFGWHLLQVLERRTADASTERKRLEARKALRERKSDEAYQEWLRQLRDRAYVEYRLDER